MKLSIIQIDITKVKVDAVVNSANKTLLGGLGVDGAVHKAAGPELLEECKRIRQEKCPKGLPTGEAVATKAYNLPAKIIIHTVGPKNHFEDIALLRSCYVNSLRIAEENNCKSIAFPSISTGVHGVPTAEAVEIVKEVLQSYNTNIIEEVMLVLFSKEDFEVYSKTFNNELLS